MRNTLLSVLVIFSFLTLPAQDKRWVVALDGTGNYTTVQAALDAVPTGNTKPIVIFIKKGIYKERLVLDTRKDFVKLMGEDKTLVL